jgi:hypothetical protein
MTNTMPCAINLLGLITIPKMRLGIETMKTECAIYRARGFQYLYLEQAHSYKSEIDGFEILGPLE